MVMNTKPDSFTKTKMSSRVIVTIVPKDVETGINALPAPEKYYRER